jgi:hypothetical protein
MCCNTYPYTREMAAHLGGVKLFQFQGAKKSKITPFFCPIEILARPKAKEPDTVSGIFGRDEIIETISWKIYNQPIIIQTICNQSHDNGNGNGINHSQTATTAYQIMLLQLSLPLPRNKQIE